MTPDNVLLCAGQVIGTLMRASAADYLAAQTPGLSAVNRAHLELVASWRRSLDALTGDDPGPKGGG